MNEGTDVTAGAGPEPAVEGPFDASCMAEQAAPLSEVGGLQASAAAESTEPDTAGRALAARRAALSLSQADLATRLKLAVRQIEAIERDDWRSFASAAVIKGVVRAYAKAVQADPDALIAKLPALDDQAVALTLQPTLTAPMPAQHRAGIPRWGWVLAGVLILVGAAAAIVVQAGWWQRFVAPIIAVVSSTEGSAERAAPSDQRTESNSTVVAPLALAASAATTPGIGRDVSVAPRPAVDAVPVDAAASAQVPAASIAIGSKGRLHIEVVQESWIEVIDATGKVVLSALQPAGARQDLDGSGALTLVVGNAPGVRVAFAGKPVDLSPHTRSNVARVTLN